MGKMSYYDMRKCLCKELACEFEKFETDACLETLKGIKDLIESLVGLAELEASDAMRDYFEDEHGYDSRSGEFKNRLWDDPYRIRNAARRYPTTTMTGGTYTNPTYTGMPYGGDYDMYDGMYINRGRERSGGGYERSGDMRGRSGGYRNHGKPYERDYEDEWEDDDERYGVYRNAGRGRRGGERRRDSRGRYTNRIYNMADDHDVKKSMKKLTEKEKDEWVKDLENDDGTRGETFSKAEVESIARKHNIKFDDYDLDTLWLMSNVMYSDYCGVLSKIQNGNQPANYVKLAVAFLDDPDSDLDPEMKVSAYYHNIVDTDDDN